MRDKRRSLVSWCTAAKNFCRPSNRSSPSIWTRSVQCAARASCQRPETSAAFAVTSSWRTKRNPASLINRSFTPPASAVVAAVTGQPLELVRPLMESLESDLLPHDPDEAPRLYRLRPHPFGRALDHALAEWERLESLGAR